MESRGGDHAKLNRRIGMIPDFVGVCDREGKLVSAHFSFLAERLDHSSVIGKTWHEINLPLEVVEAIESRRHDVVKSAKVCLEEVVSRSHGEASNERIVECMLVPIPGESGSVDRVLVTLRDVTAARREENELRESERQYRLLAKNSTDMISRHDSEGNYLYVSPSCRSIVGREPSAMIGRGPFGFIHPDDIPEASRMLRKLQAEPSEMFTVSLRALHADGHYIWIETTLRALHDQATGEVIEIQASTRDITRKHSAEECFANKTSGSWRWPRANVGRIRRSNSPRFSSCRPKS